MGPVSLVAAGPEAVESSGLRQAIREGLGRGFRDEFPVLPPDAQLYAVQRAGDTVGLVAIGSVASDGGEARVLMVVIDPRARGRASGTRALLAAEQRLLADGASRVLVRVPGTNGRGLYFMLRAGFTPVPGTEDCGVTWFVRGGRS